MPMSLYLVRPKSHTDRHGDPSKHEPPFGIEATFTDRAAAEEYQRQREAEEEAKANRGPVWDLMYTLICNGESIRSLSDFDPPVFDDWLADHDIPDPDTAWDQKRYEGDLIGDYLESLGPDRFRKLLAALHRFRYFEIVEVPLVVGDYAEEQREAWEQALPVGPPAPPGARVDSAMNQVVLENALREIAEILGEEPPAGGTGDDAIPF